MISPAVQRNDERHWLGFCFIFLTEIKKNGKERNITFNIIVAYVRPLPTFICKTPLSRIFSIIPFQAK